MLNRVMVVCVALLLVGVNVASAQEATPEIPDGPYMAIWISNNWEPDGNDVAGESCPSSLFFPLGVGFGGEIAQIIVRDEANWIIAVHTLQSAWYQNTDNGDLYCVDKSLIPLPEAKVYQVFLNDQWITAYTPETLPTDPDRGLYLNLE